MIKILMLASNNDNLIIESFELYHKLRVAHLKLIKLTPEYIGSKYQVKLSALVNKAIDRHKRRKQKNL